jgi:hypothetical protein
MICTSRRGVPPVAAGTLWSIAAARAPSRARTIRSSAASGEQRAERNDLMAKTEYLLPTAKIL